ncbi:MAG: hypothetical protein HUU34_09170 [Saprospiraceae bacterium]|jgi:hypothetical protein|nr:hypothetical protein [Saprospiraceae bacterium]
MVVDDLKLAIESSEVRDYLWVASVGAAVGYLSRRLFIRESHGPVKRLIAGALVFGVTNYVAKHPEEVKLGGRILMNLVRNAFQCRPVEPQNVAPTIPETENPKIP